MGLVGQAAGSLGQLALHGHPRPASRRKLAGLSTASEPHDDAPPHPQVVPPQQLTLEQLAAYAGSDSSKPIYLAVQGVVFDVTAGVHPGSCRRRARAGAEWADACGTRLALQGRTSMGSTERTPLVAGSAPEPWQSSPRKTRVRGGRLRGGAGARRGRAYAEMAWLGHQPASQIAEAVLADCNDNLEGCTLAEIDALRDWQARFYQKYTIIGEIVKK